MEGNASVGRVQGHGIDAKTWMTMGSGRLPGGFQGRRARQAASCPGIQRGLGNGGGPDRVLPLAPVCLDLVFIGPEAPSLCSYSRLPQRNMHWNLELPGHFSDAGAPPLLVARLAPSSQGCVAGFPNVVGFFCSSSASSEASSSSSDGARFSGRRRLVPGACRLEKHTELAPDRFHAEWQGVCLGEDEAMLQTKK